MIRSRIPGTGWALVPGLSDLRSYQRRQWRPDIIAGVTIAAVAIPASLGMGDLAGLSPMAGLYATLLPMAAYCLFGSSRQLIVGPEGATAALTAVTIAPLAAGDPGRYAALAAMLALVLGVLVLLGALLRLGFMADFLSKPVLIGYINGTAIIIIASQLGKLFGVSITSRHPFPTVFELFRKIGGISWQTTLLSAILLGLIFGLRRIAPKVPGTLVAVVIAAIASPLLNLQDHGIAVVGDIAGGLPIPKLPLVPLQDVFHMILPAAGLALVAFADTAANARIYAARHGYEIDPNRELAALGAANIAGGLTSAFPTSSSGSRTALNDNTGGTSQVVALIAAGIVAIVAAVATPLIEPLPTAVLGVVVVASAIGLLDFRSIVRLRRVRTAEAGLAVAAMIGVLTLGILGGLALAIVLSIGVYVYRSIRPHDAILGQSHTIDGYHDIDRIKHAQTVDGLIVYRFDAPLYFPNAGYFRERVLALCDTEPKPTWLLLNAEAIVYIDSTAIDTLRQVHGELAEQGITLVIARAKGMLRDVFAATGLTETIGAGNFYPTVTAAVDAYRSSR